MSVDALKQVFGDPSPLPPGVQAVCLALAWRTPPGRDSTWPVSHRDLAEMTRYSVRTIRRLILEAIAHQAIEIVWARPGEPSRYRLNRGEWHIPTDPKIIAEALRRLARDRGEQITLDVGPEGDITRGGVGQDGSTSPDITRGGVGHDARGHRKKKREKEIDPATGAPMMLVDTAEPDPTFVARFAHLFDDGDPS